MLDINDKINTYIINTFGSEPTKENIDKYLKNNLITKDQLDQLIDFNILINYKSEIIKIFGTEYYYEKREKFFKDAILNDELTIEIINKIKDKLFMNTFCDIILEKFGIEQYNQLIASYN